MQDNKNYLENSRRYKGYGYKDISQEALDYLHRKGLEMLNSIQVIFETHQIRYYIVGGTLLGAVCYQKFIPWDDDVDICIEEADYDKAKHLLIKMLPDNMYVQCSDTETKYYHGWMKVRDTNSEVVPKENLYNYNGVWVDLYRLRTMPRKWVSFLVAKEHIDYLIRRSKVGGLTGKELIIRMKSTHLLKKYFNTLISSILSKDDKEVCVVWSASKVVVRKEITEKKSSILFEGLVLPSFGDVEEYLIEHYGKQFREFPPEEMRRVSIKDVIYLK